MTPEVLAERATRLREYQREYMRRLRDALPRLPLAEYRHIRRQAQLEYQRAYAAVRAAHTYTDERGWEMARPGYDAALKAINAEHQRIVGEAWQAYLAQSASEA
jgi:hypothetical protein